MAFNVFGKKDRATVSSTKLPKLKKERWRFWLYFSRRKKKRPPTAAAAAVTNPPAAAAPDKAGE